MYHQLIYNFFSIHLIIYIQFSWCLLNSTRVVKRCTISYPFPLYLESFWTKGISVRSPMFPNRILENPKFPHRILDSTPNIIHTFISFHPLTQSPEVPSQDIWQSGHPLTISSLTGYMVVWSHPHLTQQNLSLVGILCNNSSRGKCTHFSFIKFYLTR